jgi:farnesyl-diphosphate farnesyltransferase
MVGVLMSDAEQMLRETSHTFYAPTMYLTGSLRDAVTGAYLSLRAIDEIEDHPSLPDERKGELLTEVARILQRQFIAEDFTDLLGRPEDDLAPVTMRIHEWLTLAPADIAPRIWEATSSMAVRMVDWTFGARRIHMAGDLDEYTFAVAGAVGLLLSDVWAWHDGTRTDRCGAVALGRGLQAVDILRGQEEDRAQGFFYVPDGWGDSDLIAYAIEHLRGGDEYVRSLPHGGPRSFCASVLALGWAGIEDAVGGTRLTPERGMQIVQGRLADGAVEDRSEILAVAVR